MFRSIPGFILLMGMFVSLVVLSVVQREQQFALLSRSMIKGVYYFLDYPGTWDDAILWKGKYFWHMGPMPAVLLAPLVILNGNISQREVQPILTGGILIMVWWLAKRFGYSDKDSLWLCLGFGFASVVCILFFISWSWMFSQAVVLFFSLLSLVEWFTKRRLWVIGIFLAVMFGSRVTSGIGVGFYLLMLVNNKISVKTLITRSLQLTIPIIIIFFLQLFYNYIRFGDAWANPMKMTNEFILSDKDRFEQINYGLFQIRNIPTNFYYYFLKGLDGLNISAESRFGQSYVLRPPYFSSHFPGTSFFVSSAFFIYIFKSNLKNKIVRSALLISAVTLLVLLMWYWPGWPQVGPRYTMDFLPYLYIVLLLAFKDRKINNLMKVLIAGGSVLNIYLVFCVFLLRI